MTQSILKKSLDKIELDDVLEEMYTQEFTLKNLSNYGVNARHLQYWQDHGLLLNEERKTNENHKFNFVELIWIQIICELRIFNFPITKIKIVRDTLFHRKSLIEFAGFKEGDNIKEFIYKLFPKLREYNTKFDGKEAMKLFSNMTKNATFPMLGILLYEFINDRKNYNIIIFSNGELTLLPSDDNPETIEIMKKIEDKAYMSIPMMKMMSQFTWETSNKEFILNYRLLNKKELQILQLIKLNDFDSIKISFKNKEPYLIEATENIKVSMDARISEIMLKRGYETLEIKTSEGNIVYSPKTTKIIL